MIQTTHNPEFETEENVDLEAMLHQIDNYEFSRVNEPTQDEMPQTIIGNLYHKTADHGISIYEWDESGEYDIFDSNEGHFVGHNIQDIEKVVEIVEEKEL